MRGDQETRDDEEHVDADVAASDTRNSSVVGNDEEDGYCPQPLHVRAEAQLLDSHPGAV